ncbi:hypothetical protein AVEN_137476-1 [Araneus ventricosus]|uniref:Uncharacterized protein n=1 Tax=Araneus ventricosus TaxID=182803 RepID=A0A4Y2P0U0_ARAVE|nr:hypothetical protein AVEN_137476-1 [Araneus ventricosus]
MDSKIQVKKASVTGGTGCKQPGKKKAKEKEFSAERLRILCWSHTNTKKKRIVLRIMAIIPRCERPSVVTVAINDGEGKMEYQGLLDSCQVVQTTAHNTTHAGPAYPQGCKALSGPAGKEKSTKPSKRQNDQCKL